MLIAVVPLLKKAYEKCFIPCFDDINGRSNHAAHKTSTDSRRKMKWYTIFHKFLIQNIRLYDIVDNDFSAVYNTQTEYVGLITSPQSSYSFLSSDRLVGWKCSRVYLVKYCDSETWWWHMGHGLLYWRHWMISFYTYFSSWAIFNRFLRRPSSDQITNKRQKTVSVTWFWFDFVSLWGWAKRP